MISAYLLIFYSSDELCLYLSLLYCISGDELWPLFTDYIYWTYAIFSADRIAMNDFANHQGQLVDNSITAPTQKKEKRKKPAKDWTHYDKITRREIMYTVKGWNIILHMRGILL